MLRSGADVDRRRTPLVVREGHRRVVLAAAGRPRPRRSVAGAVPSKVQVGRWVPSEEAHPARGGDDVLARVHVGYGTAHQRP